MELVIKLSKEDYEIMKYNIAVNNPLCPLSQEEMISKVAHGIPLPKGHGRLIDANTVDKSVKNPYQNREVMYWINNAPTILEADKEREDKE